MEAIVNNINTVNLLHGQLVSCMIQ